MLDSTYLLFVCLICTLVAWLANHLRRPYNYPPGPRWLPVVGNSPQLRRLARAVGGTHRALAIWANTYSTSVLGLRLGGDYVVVLFGAKTVREALCREEFDGRPDNFFIRLRTMGSRMGITCTEGQLWTEQRNFVVRHLRQVGYGKQAMEDQIVNELKELISVIDALGNSVNFGRELAPSVINVLWTLTAGKRISRDDQRLERLLTLLSQRSKAFDTAGGSLSQMPWLRFIIPESSGYNLLLRFNKELHSLFMETITDHRNNHKASQADDLIHAYITEMESRKGKPSTFTDVQLTMVILDIFIAGSQTTSNTLDFAFLMMLNRPDLQMKIHQEIDEVLGNNLPKLEDRAKMPFVEAVLLEVQRYFHIVTLNGPRRVTRDTTIGGYNIQKDTTVLMSLYSLHKDVEYWGDPENFRPERFLSEEGYLKPSDHLIPFALGKRRCLGEALAKACMFIFFTGILQHYELYVDNDQEKPSIDPIPGITLSPRPYKANVRKRIR
ncbi:probable cytochrome P450 305a1 [Ctenocephalides felis]|uniref:probable cytochrome P450 305a1 n=1 Tax=Ctenocephalides felis TaxID=7515 RepID=UPI000E6E19F8|nr:probable cytochrome P450 305a1 [Ctenocephalides felis]